MKPERSRLAALAPPEDWMSWEESEKAWMSVRDADLLELLLVAHCERLGRPARVLEWGAGRSTLHYSRVLEEHNALGRWLSLEHNRQFFTESVAPELAQRASASYLLAEDLTGASPTGAPPVGAVGAGPKADAARVCAVIFDAGDLRPYDEDRLGDREADLDAYVKLPASLGERFDAVLVDGRKRRRCLLEASRLLTDDGIVILHDAWRKYYQCAWGAFAFSTRAGDMLWIGAQRDPRLNSILPAHAFENHADHD